MQRDDGVRCDGARLALSALLDGESLPPGMALASVERHLTDCAMCRSWRTRAERVTRSVRVRTVDVPDLTASILAAVLADGSLPRPAPQRGRDAARGRVRVGVRWTLGLLAAAQLMLAVPDLLGAVGHEAHAGREVAAFDIALAVGLLVAACYPEHARVFAPVLLTLVVCFASISALDIVQGVVTPGRVAVHVLAVIQAGLVYLLARTTPVRMATA